MNSDTLLATLGSWAAQPGNRLAVAEALLGLAVLMLFASRLIYWIKQGRILQATPGYITHRVTYMARLVRYLGARVFVYFKAGPLTVYGAENLKVLGRKMFLINHQDERDAVVLPALLGTMHFRALMAVNQIHGWRSPAAAWVGIIPVHHDRNPRAAVTASIAVLKGETHSSMGAFPQGELIRENKLVRKQWQAGATMIVLKAAKDSEDQFYVVPMYFYYDRDPAHATWGHKVLRFLNKVWVVRRLVRLVGLGNFRVWFGTETSAVYVNVGKPIPVKKSDDPEQLPNDRDAAMDLVFDRVVALRQELEDKLDKKKAKAA